MALLLALLKAIFVAVDDDKLLSMLKFTVLVPSLSVSTRVLASPALLERAVKVAVATAPSSLPVSV